jgi:hypothetical protein
MLRLPRLTSALASAFLLFELLQPNQMGPGVVAICHAAANLRVLTQKLLQNATKRWVEDIATCLRRHQHTASFVREEEAAAAEPEWWTKLTEEQREMLNDEAEDNICCIVTSEVMCQPVTLVASGGHEIYERSAIRRYLEGVRGEKRDPRTNVPVGNDFTLLPNNTLQRQIRSWCEERVNDAS